MSNNNSRLLLSGNMLAVSVLAQLTFLVAGSLIFGAILLCLSAGFVCYDVREIRRRR